MVLDGTTPAFPVGMGVPPVVGRAGTAGDTSRLGVPPCQRPRHGDAGQGDEGGEEQGARQRKANQLHQGVVLAAQPDPAQDESNYENSAEPFPAHGDEALKTGWGAARVHVVFCTPVRLREAVSFFCVGGGGCWVAPLFMASARVRHCLRAVSAIKGP